MDVAGGSLHALVKHDIVIITSPVRIKDHVPGSVSRHAAAIADCD